MAIWFFYISIAVIAIILLISARIRKIRLANILIALTTVGYSLTNDTIFGLQLKLFHYIDLQVTALYMVLAGIFLYPLLNILYTMFLPSGRKKVIAYTCGWIVALVLFEYLSIVTKTIVFTGWQPVPWSVVTYIVAYLWIYHFYMYLVKNTKPV